MAEAKKTSKVTTKPKGTPPPSRPKGPTLQTESAEDILKAKKSEAKAAKKAGPKAIKAKTEAKEIAKPKVKAAPVIPKPRDPLVKRGKKYRQVYETVDQTREYDLNEAVALLPKTSFVKFDPSVEIHINLGIDTKQAEQMVRGTVSLPHGSGKTQHVAALVSDDKQKDAKAAGADVVGNEELLEAIGKGKFDFDILVTTPDMMAQLGKHAKILGLKGLMPNPKSGTVTNNLVKTIKELKGGRIEFRTDTGGIIHQITGKLSLKPEQLIDNIKTLLKAVNQVRPSGIKGTYISKISLATSMGPSLRLDTKAVLKDL